MDNYLEQSARPCQSIASGLALLGSWDLQELYLQKLGMSTYKYFLPLDGKEHRSTLPSSLYNQFILISVSYRNDYAQAAATKAAYASPVP